MDEEELRATYEVSATIREQIGALLMEEAYRSEGGLEDFFAAREQFEAIVNKLHSAEAAKLEHGDIALLRICRKSS